MLRAIAAAIAVVASVALATTAISNDDFDGDTKATEYDYGCGPDPLRVDKYYRAHIKSTNAREVIFSDLTTERTELFLAAFNRTNPPTDFTAHRIYFAYIQGVPGALLVLLDDRDCVKWSWRYSLSAIHRWMRGQATGEQRT